MHECGLKFKVLGKKNIKLAIMSRMVGVKAEGVDEITERKNIAKEKFCNHDEFPQLEFG